MQLLAELERALGAEESLFRAQLLREDIARLKKLRAMAQAQPDAAAFRKAGMRVGWTPGDARTLELREPLEKLLDDIHAYEHGAREPEQEARITEAWQALHRLRIDRLLGCLATPVPRPAD
jgi:hypothetical protein